MTDKWWSKCLKCGDVKKKEDLKSRVCKECRKTNDEDTYNGGSVTPEKGRMK